uniref:MIF4G domain-containing protein n=1 Tax=viral metagenome TaxID=1070528 RepID=A0A6C0CP56_9ZZZZ
MLIYSLDEIYNIYKNNISTYELDSSVIDILNDINSNIVPIHVEKLERPDKIEKRDTIRKKNNRGFTKKEDIEIFNEKYKPKCMTEEKPEGLEKWLDNINIALNKLSSKNYDTQRDIIINNLRNSMDFSYSSSEERSEHLKVIINSVFSTASSNRFHSKLYANIFQEIIVLDKCFNDILTQYLSAFSNGLKEIQYVNSIEDYEKYCYINRKNDIRKASTVFLVHLMTVGVVPILKILNTIVSIQTLVLEYIEQDNKVNEVEELSEIMYLFLKEGKEKFEECKGEWIWKFMIKKNIETLSKYSKKDKKSLSSRAIFKYMDMIKLV